MKFKTVSVEAVRLFNFFELEPLSPVGTPTIPIEGLVVFTSC